MELQKKGFGRVDTFIERALTYSTPAIGLN